MKFIILSNEKDLIFLESSLNKPSILFRFFRNQLKKKNIRFIVISLTIIKSQILLKLVEFFRHKYIEYNQRPFYCLLLGGNFMNEWENSNELYSEQWYKNFIKIKIISLIELLVSGYFFGIDEIIDLSLYGIAVFFIQKMNKRRELQPKRIELGC